MSAIDELSREKLLVLINNFAKNWLAHDGLWFQVAALPARQMSIRMSTTVAGSFESNTKATETVEPQKRAHSL
jgi:hypothetical protein